MLLQTDSSDRSQVITGEQTRALPLNGREYSALALLSPGVRAVAAGHRRLHAARGLVQRQRPALDVQQLPDRRRRQQRLRHQQPGLLEPGDAAVARRGRRVQGRHQQHERRVRPRRPARRSTSPTPAAPTSSAARRWEFARRTGAQRHRLLPAGRRREAAVRARSVRRRARRPDRPQQGVLLRRLRGLPARRAARPRVTTIPTLAQRQGILTVDVRNPLTGAVYPAGTPIPMTAFARKVLTELPAPTSGGTSNNYAGAAELRRTTPTRPAARSTSSVSPRLSAFGRFGWRDVDIFDNPNIPLPSGGGGNAETYVAQQAARRSARPTRRPATSLLEVRFGWSRHDGRQEPGGARARPVALDAYGITGLPTDPRVAGGLPTQLITGYSRPRPPGDQPAVAVPDGLQPEGQLLVAGGPPLAQDRLRVPAHSDRSAGRQPALRPRRVRRPVHAGRPASAANNLYNLADFMFGAALDATRSATSWSPTCGRTCTSRYLQDDWRVNDRLTLNLGPALRVRDAVGREGQHPVELRSRRRGRWCWRATARCEDRSTLKPDRNNFGPRLGFAYTLTPATVLRGGYGISYVHFHRAGGANVLPINGPQVINAVVVQTPTQADFRHDAAGLPGGADRSVALQPAGRQHHLHARGLPLEPGAELVRLGAARAVAAARWSTSPTSATAPTTCCCSPTSTRRRRTTAPARMSLQARRPIPEFADITYSFNGGKSRYHAFQGKFDWRMGAGSRS